MHFHLFTLICTIVFVFILSLSLSNGRARTNDDVVVHGLILFERFSVTPYWVKKQMFSILWHCYISVQLHMIHRTQNEKTATMSPMSMLLWNLFKCSTHTEKSPATTADTKLNDSPVATHASSVRIHACVRKH